MTTNTKLQINGYGTDAVGRLVCYRTPEYRYAHEQLAVIQISAPKDFAAKVIAALDEPAALVGVGPSGAVVLFRPSARNVYAKHDFIFEGKQGLLVATIEGTTPIDVGEFKWRNGRSPLNTRRNDLPPLFDDHVEAAFAAVTEFGATLGSLPTAAEIAAETARQERLAKIQEEIAAGMHTPEKIAEREDEKLAARWHPDMTMHDGVMTQNIIAAHRRVARRKSGTAPPVLMTGAM